LFNGIQLGNTAATDNGERITSAPGEIAAKAPQQAINVSSPGSMVRDTERSHQQITIAV